MPVNFAVSASSCVPVNPGDVTTVEKSPSGGTQINLRSGKKVLVMESPAQVIALLTTYDAEVQRERDRAARRLTMDHKYEQL